MNRLTAVALGVGFLLSATVTGAQPVQPGIGGQSAFRTLTGQAARGFQAPSDMRLVRQARVGAGGDIVAEYYRQYLGDAEVLGGQLTVYRDASGVRDAVIGAHFADLVPVNSVRLAAGNAQGIAIARRNDPGAAFNVTLMIDPQSARYFYRVESRSLEARWFYWVDADTGAILNEYDGFATAGDDVGVNGDTKDINSLTTFSSGAWRLQSGRQKTYDAQNRTGLPGVLGSDADNVWNTPGRTSPGQPALVDAHFYANVTDSYLLATHGFNWTDSYTQGMVSSAHYKRNYNNAGWNGTQMVYGDGDGVTFRELSGDLDVVGHELAHGVTEATSDLIYQNESGALNEAFSDIIGTAIEYHNATGNWTIGEDITIGSNGIRNMQNPPEDGDPSHYADRYTGTSDNGGVHVNSGIANHWFYLLVEGGQNAKASRRSGTNVVGIGLGEAENIAFLGFTALPASATFCQARAATIAVAGTFADNVGDAWGEVGVDTALCGSGGGDPDPNAPVITNVGSNKLRGGKFRITWTTDVPADSAVTFTCCGTYTNATLVTSHSMQFNGSIGYLYEYYVTSKDANGSSTTAGPFTHQN